MSRFMRGRVPVLSALLFLATSHPAKSQQQKEWTWKDLNGQTRIRAELDSILKEHDLWVKSSHQSGEQAILARADLTGANLIVANLNRAALGSANLTGAELGVADLHGADLSDTNLTGAELNYADLTSANLSGANLSGADLRGVDLAGADFEPTSLPEVRVIATGLNLELMTYKDNPDALVQLRKAFADGGFREQERKITYALKRREAEMSWEGCKPRKTGDKTRAILWSSDSNLANCASFVLNRVFFDWTCQYGMTPGRPLSLGVVLWLLCSVLYFVCIHVPGKTGLYRVYAQTIEEDPTAHKRIEEIVPSEMKAHGAKRLVEFVRCEGLLLRASMFFSLMSAFNIGFRDINFGRWLRLLTRQEFDIKAVGWARVIAGWQSLISVYLLALWVLTYFGRPFG
jgi:uncharacterized protein YjbI with pentapeptide repeats